MSGEQHIPSDTKSIDPLPCPHCGDTELDGSPFPCDRERTRWAMRCGNPDCTMGIEAGSRDEVVSMWNRRWP